MYHSYLLLALGNSVYSGSSAGTDSREEQEEDIKKARAKIKGKIISLLLLLKTTYPIGTFSYFFFKDNTFVGKSFFKTDSG